MEERRKREEQERIKKEEEKLMQQMRREQEIEKRNVINQITKFLDEKYAQENSSCETSKIELNNLLGTFFSFLIVIFYILYFSFLRLY